VSVSRQQLDRSISIASRSRTAFPYSLRRESVRYRASGDSAPAKRGSSSDCRGPHEGIASPPDRAAADRRRHLAAAQLARDSFPDGGMRAARVIFEIVSRKPPVLRR